MPRDLFNDVMLESITINKWAQRIMYTLQTGEFNLSDGELGHLKSSMTAVREELQLNCKEIQKRER